MPSDHVAGGSYPERVRLGLLTRTFTPELVDLAVEEAGVREERTRSLPSTLMVYFTLAMWLFTGQGYAPVLREMVENIPRRAGERRRAANAGSLAVARCRLGQAPLRLLFDKVAGACGTAATPGAFWPGAAAAVDGRHAAGRAGQRRERRRLELLTECCNSPRNEGV
ncbi:transposase domain-containing protein [Streptomyces sp. NPDC002513]